MKKRIGVIIDTLDGQYQHEVSNGLIKEAAFHDVQLVFFSSQVFHSHVILKHEYDNIFDLPCTENIDGLFLIISSLKNLYGDIWTSNLLKQYKPIPLVSLSIPMEGAINISHDNEKGIREIINHLLEHVSLNEIAFISGPSSNAEAVIRLKTYKGFYTEHKIEFNDNYCYEGNFLGHSGGNAVDYFIKQNTSLPKAIVCANDEMAIGAYLRLAELGYSVPEDILITGYDNVNIARDIFPAFTTYDQGFYNMCKLSMIEMIAYIKGESSPSTKLSSGQLIIRESCGCSPLPISLRKSVTHNIEINASNYEDALESFEKYVLSHYKNIEDIMMNHLHAYKNIEIISKEISVELSRGLLIDIKNNTADGSFIKALIKLLRFELVKIDNPSYLQEFLQSIKLLWLSHAFNSKLILHIQELFFNAITIVEENFRRKQRQQQYKFSNMYLMSREMVLSLNGSKSIEETCDVLYRHLPVYDISQFYLCLFDEVTYIAGPSPSSLPLECQLAIGNNNGRRIGEVTFRTLDLLPNDTLIDNPNTNYLFLSLFSGNEQYGYIVFSMDGVDYLIYETLRAQISEALKRHSITKLRIEAEMQLNDALSELELSNKLLTKQSTHDELTGIYNRRGFFITSENYFKDAVLRNKCFYVIFGDIDGLKYINDTFGHKEGDFAIKKISEVISKVLDQQHVFARMSGDEFIILAKDVLDQKVINTLVKFIHYQLSSYNDLKEKEYELNISFGVAKFDSQIYESLDQLILEADKNLYKEKAIKKKVKTSVRES